MENYKKEFLDVYLSTGMGALSKRDMDVLVMHLLDKYGLSDGVPLKTLSNQELSVKLKAPVSRIKALRYEAALKYQENNVALAKWKLLEVLARAKFDVEKDKVAFVIEDSFTRTWLHGVLKSEGLFFDGSFNSEIVKVDSSGLMSVLAVLYDKKSVESLAARVEEIKSKASSITFLEAKKEFLKGVASGAGKGLGGIVSKESLLALLA